MAKKEQQISVADDEAQEKPELDVAAPENSATELTDAPEPVMPDQPADDTVEFETPEQPADDTSEAEAEPSQPVDRQDLEDLVDLKPSEYKPLQSRWVLALIAVAVIIIVILFISLLSKSPKPANSSVSDQWVPFSSSGGNFRALFPKQPSVTSKNVASGGQNYTETTVQSDKSTAVYQVVYTSPEQESDTSSTLNTLVSETVNNLPSGQLVSSSITSVSGHKAEIFQISGVRNGGNVYMDGEFVIAGNIQYALLASQYYAIAPDAQYFLNNFKID